MSAVGENNLIDVVNDFDVPVGQVRRCDVFARHVTFRVAHVLVFNSRNHVLIQRLALDRHRHPGYWGSSVAAYLYPSETYEMAARRRMAEELGIQFADLQGLGKITMEDEGARKFIGVFRSLEDGPFQIDRSHIDRVEFVSISEILQMRASGERLFTPTFIRVLEFYVQEL